MNRCISKTELGLAYFPDSCPDTARRHLVRWINDCPRLLSALRHEGYSSATRVFTKRQLQLIYDHFGPP